MSKPNIDPKYIAKWKDKLPNLAKAMENINKMSPEAYEAELKKCTIEQLPELTLKELVWHALYNEDEDIKREAKKLLTPATDAQKQYEDDQI